MDVVFLLAFGEDFLCRHRYGIVNRHGYLCLGRHRRAVPMESVEGDSNSKFNTKSFISQIQFRFFCDDF
jgi:hypothetical protein